MLQILVSFSNVTEITPDCKEQGKTSKFLNMKIKAETPKKEPLNLSVFKSLQDKINSIYEYLKIDKIFLEISNPKDVTQLAPVLLLHVTNMIVPGGIPSYVKSKLTECYEILKPEISNYPQSDNDYENILEQLEICIELCKNAAAEIDRDNRFAFNEKINFYVKIDETYRQALFNWLQLPGEFLIDLEEHFDTRKHFFLELEKELTSAINAHKQKTDLATKPYYWDSPNAELEISEILYVLHTLLSRIKITKAKGASFAKFNRDFFGLFGLTDSNYSKKIYQIRDRKLNESFINEMASSMENFHAKT